MKDQTLHRLLHLFYYFYCSKFALSADHSYDELGGSSADDEINSIIPEPRINKVQ